MTSGWKRNKRDFATFWKSSIPKLTHPFPSPVSLRSSMITSPARWRAWTRRGRPLFLKIPYNGPKALEELVHYDPQLIVGILGGSAGTTYDAFKMIADAQRYGARVALFGRKINLSEHPLIFIEMLCRIVDHEISAEEAVKAYHDRLKGLGIEPAPRPCR
jgi:hypothetical protein